MGKTCNGCGTKPIEMATVTMSAAAWELHEQRQSREKMWLCAVIVLLVLALIITNAAWLILNHNLSKWIWKNITKSAKRLKTMAKIMQ